MFVDKVVAGGKKAEIVFLADVALEPQYADPGILVHKSFEGHGCQGAVRARSALEQVLPLVLGKITGGVVGGVEQAEGVLAMTPGQFGGDVRIDDSARVDQVQRALENVYPLEEKRPFFREKISGSAG